ncbi:hypothetical protein Emed_003751 [Eimeria media]
MAVWGRSPEAAPSVFLAADPHRPSEWNPAEFIIPQTTATLRRNNNPTSWKRRPPRGALSLPLLFAACTALIFLVSACVRSLRDGGGSLERGALARSLAVGGSGGDCGEGEGNNNSSILKAAEQQLETLSISQAVSALLKPEELAIIHQAQHCLLAEVAAIRRDESQRAQLLELLGTTEDKGVRANLLEDISRVQQALGKRNRTLQFVGYVEQQRVRELVAMAESWCKAREIPIKAAAAIVASWRVTEPSKPVSAVLAPSERITVKRFTGILLNRGQVYSSKLQSGPSPSPDLLTSANEFLVTAQQVVELLIAAKMKKEARSVEDMCESLTSNLDPSTVGQPKLKSTLSWSSLSSTVSRLRRSLSRGSITSLGGDESRRHSYHERPRKRSEAASDSVSFPSLVASPPEDAATVSVSAGDSKIQKLEKWNDEAYRKLLHADLRKVTRKEMESLEALWIVGNRQFAEVKKVETDPGSDKKASETEVITSCEYFLREISLLLSAEWIKQLSESKHTLEKRRELFKDALIDISPDSAPPAGSSLFQHMMQLRAAIAQSRSLVARLESLHRSPQSRLHLVPMISAGLAEAAHEANELLEAASARVAASWTNRLSAMMPTTGPQPVTPLSGLSASIPSDSAATQGAKVLKELLKLGLELPEFDQLEAAVKAAGATGAS